MGGSINPPLNIQHTRSGQIDRHNQQIDRHTHAYTGRNGRYLEAPGVEEEEVELRQRERQGPLPPATLCCVAPVAWWGRDGAAPAPALGVVVEAPPVLAQVFGQGGLGDEGVRGGRRRGEGELAWRAVLCRAVFVDKLIDWLVGLVVC